MAEPEENSEHSPVLEAEAASSIRQPRQASKPYPSISPKKMKIIYYKKINQKEKALFGYLSF